MRDAARELTPEQRVLAMLFDRPDWMVRVGDWCLRDVDSDDSPTEYRLRHPHAITRFRHWVGCHVYELAEQQAYRHRARRERKSA